MHKQMQVYFYIAVLLLVGVAAVLMIAPYLKAVILAGAFAVIFKPVYRWQLQAIHGYNNLAALLTTFIAISAVLIPLILIGGLVFVDAISMINSLRSTGTADDILMNLLQTYAPTLADNFVVYVKQISSSVASQIGGFLSGFVQASISSILGLMAFFYFLKDGDKFLARIIELSPLDDKYDRKIIDRLETAVTSVVQGAIIIALIQGVLAGLGLAIFGVPSPTLWGSVAAVAAMIPTVGTSLVMIPAVLYLLIIDHSGQALGLAIWALVVVGLIDNLLSPYLIGKGARLHPYLILISVLGGIQFFGPIGFLLGPLLLSLLFALFDLYPIVIEGHSEGLSTRRKSRTKA
jgi:predicted PurR-regulated permease PerM